MSILCKAGTQRERAPFIKRDELALSRAGARGSQLKSEEKNRPRKTHAKAMSLPSGPLIFVFIYLLSASPSPSPPHPSFAKVLRRSQGACRDRRLPEPGRSPNSVAINLRVRGANKEDRAWRRGRGGGGGGLRVSSEINIDGEN